MKLILVAVAAALSLSACATITRGTTQAFEVKTTPSGASVKTSNGLYCDATPCVFAKVDRKAEFDVTITKPGYKTVVSRVTNTLSGGGGTAMAGNVIFGGVIGAVVDGTNGSMNDLVPNPLEVVLESDLPPGFTPSPTTPGVAQTAPAAGTPAG